MGKSKPRVDKHEVSSNLMYLGQGLRAMRVLTRQAHGGLDSMDAVMAIEFMASGLLLHVDAAERAIGNDDTYSELED